MVPLSGVVSLKDALEELLFGIVFKPFAISTYLTSGILCAIMCLLAKTGGRVILPSSLGPSLVEGLSYGSIKKQRVYSLSNSYSK
jgi:hypothetical protein